MLLENVAMTSGTHFTDYNGYFGRSINTGDSKKHNIHPYVCLCSHAGSSLCHRLACDLWLWSFLAIQVCFLTILDYNSCNQVMASEFK